MFSVFNIKYCTSDKIRTEAAKIWDHLFSAETLYPSIFEWFERSVLTGLLNNERTILSLYVNGCLAGFSILKHSKYESKICTFSILKSYRRQGLGSMLMQRSICYFNGIMPGITVSEPLLNDFHRLLSVFNFGTPLLYDSPYLPYNNEFVFDPQRRVLPLPGNRFYYVS